MFKKSKKNYVKLTGKVAWARLYSPDEYRGKKFYKMNFYPDDESAVTFQRLGTANKWKKDDGATSGVTGDYVVLRRYALIKTKTGERKIAPPGIYDAEGEPLITYEHDRKGRAVFDEDGDPVPVQDDAEMILIGNGSTVGVKLELYDTSDGPAVKLDSVQIIDLIEYIPPEEEEEVEPEPEPEPEPKKTTKKTASKKKDAFEW